MANTNTETESSSSYGALERFLIWFLIPIVFTAVLLGVLLTILDFDVMRGVQNALHNIPGIGKLIPAPTEKAADSKSKPSNEQNVKAKDDTIDQLNGKIAELEKNIEQTNGNMSQKDDEVKDLQAKNAALEDKIKSKTQSDVDFTKQVQELSSLFAKMNPSKAAPILENMTSKESVLVLTMMKSDDRVKVLEKMDPKKAAEVSIALKDGATLRDLEIAAQDERLKRTQDAANKGKSITSDDLGQTFSNMIPKSAASLLLEMYDVTPAKVKTILTSMDAGSRARVMSAMTDQKKDVAANIAELLAK
ncbi:magnesium transporter MgtE N-terminal domain-containing protein [Paenibacillus sp. KN14-4R]|uniref:MotE family protein n=1 Tax=Paenibacillus sp. KN14-4R TaxID=3445773 RepID=UPI003FA01178